MDWLNVFGIALGCVALAFMLLRVERRALPLIGALVVLPSLAAIAVWATLFRHWDETALGLAVAAGLMAAWWLLGGRRMARARSDTIKVWGQETAGRPKPPDAAVLQAEVHRLREESARMEAELRRLKGGNGKEDT